MKTRILASILTLGLLIAGLSGCGKAEAGNTGDSQSTELQFEGEGLNEADTIRIGYCAAALDSIALLEEEQKNLEEAFAKEGVTVELISFEKGAAVVEALAAGALDVSVPFGDTPSLTSFANHTPVTIIARGKTDPQMYQLQVPEGSDITSAEDLKGKRVAVTLGSGCHDFLLRVLNSAGLTEDDIELINIAQSDNVTILESGEVDAVANSEPNASLVLAQTNAVSLDTISSDLKLDLSFAVANNDFMKKNPKLVARFLTVLLKTYDFVTENPQEATQIMADALDVSYESASSVERWICDPDVTDEIFDQLNQTKEFLLDQDAILNDFDVHDMFDGRYLEEAKRLYESGE